MKRVLNVGSGSADIAIPSAYAGWDHVRLDIDPETGADIVLDARELINCVVGQFDVVYCSHNLEHYYRHDALKVLQGFRHVLTDDGFAHIFVPDVAAAIRAFVANGLDIEGKLYDSPAGPITVHDMIYGMGSAIAATGNDFYAHKTGFTEELLVRMLRQAGFAMIAVGRRDLEIEVCAFREERGYLKWNQEQEAA